MSLEGFSEKIKRRGQFHLVLTCILLKQCMTVCIHRVFLFWSVSLWMNLG